MKIEAGYFLVVISSKIELLILRAHWMLSEILETSKKAYEVMFSESLFNTIYAEIKKQMLKKLSSDKINVTKNALFFL